MVAKPTTGQLLKLLGDIWKFDPGDVPGQNWMLGTLSASIGLGAALTVGAVTYLERRNYFQAAADYLRDDYKVTDLVALAISAIFLLAVISVFAFLGGMIVYLSSKGRSYIGYAWQGGVVFVGGIVLYVIANMVMSSLEMVG